MKRLLKLAFYALRIIWLLLVAAVALVFVAQSLEARGGPEIVGRIIAFCVILAVWKAGEWLLCKAGSRWLRLTTQANRPLP